MNGFVEVRYKMAVKLGKRIGGLVGFDQGMWAVPPFGMVLANNWWLAGVVDYLLEVALKSSW